MVCASCLKDHGSDHDVQVFGALQDSIAQRFKKIQNEVESCKIDAETASEKAPADVMIKLHEKIQTITRMIDFVEKFVGKSLHKMEEVEVSKTLKILDRAEINLETLKHKIASV